MWPWPVIGVKREEKREAVRELGGSPIILLYCGSLQLVGGEGDHLIPPPIWNPLTNRHTHIPPTPSSPVSPSRLTHHQPYSPHIYTLLSLLCCVDRASFGSKHIWRMVICDKRPHTDRISQLWGALRGTVVIWRSHLSGSLRWEIMGRIRKQHSISFWGEEVGGGGGGGVSETGAKSEKILSHLKVCWVSTFILSKCTWTNYNKGLH